ncbi:hypothetical protein Despr_2983 [Desulfobulbus propionicus DSM 2032]|jgi:hypothetical protein|uniref:Lipoprotein n=1 Tax=Desulfobulbus propionicus (strain ATCC 33891 / DSM 2032 / VKM B-1956 / 1pr3) TaxID=577650 RepID=A0A7U3YPE3_DESPD|nr:hypothetical protein [Desulfobulbus propionicus]ADW19116.1 hypothetical protein Despr_2983 [Desulfobulbus propionicus DSM 2032]
MSKWSQFIAAAAVLAAASGCGLNQEVGKLVGLSGEDRTAYNGPVYPATNKIAIAFQSAQVDRSCRVFAEVLVQLPANQTGKDIEAAVLGEAGKRGADQVLIGQSRQSEDDNGLRFLYYGPAYEYLCDEQCGGWKFGYDLWEKQGAWVSVGYAEWGRGEAHFETPLTMQLAMLRCQ